MILKEPRIVDITDEDDKQENENKAEKQTVLRTGNLFDFLVLF
jgi:hypothetical protein